MMLECGRHVVRATFAASRVTCCVCSTGSSAVAATEVEAALREGRRRAALEVYEALGLDCEPRLRIPVYATSLVPTINTLHLVLDGLRRGPDVYKRQDQQRTATGQQRLSLAPPGANQVGEWDAFSRSGDDRCWRRPFEEASSPSRKVVSTGAPQKKLIRLGHTWVDAADGGSYPGV